MRNSDDDRDMNIPPGRRRALAVAAQALYQADLTGAAEIIPEQLAPWLEEFHVTGENKEFVSELARGTLAVRAELDAVLDSRAKGWPVARMSAVDRNLLRLALFEMFYCDATPQRVVVNEIVELAKAFGGENSSRFINGILHVLLHREETADAGEKSN
ncbi:MAG: transcription antitermination factor NusB [Gracilibacteraceae bacterium]|jgi:N utilization substance protein B|nr:transcription antitermination factor NusB [Gracilibacteraceae bacterium]